MASESPATVADYNQVEHAHISSALDVERLEQDIFRSRSLWRPSMGRGVFGGQVISQAVVAATNTVDPKYALHSLHCYFLASASPSEKIVYLIERLRNGKSYWTRGVKALQSGRPIFILICSFQIPEPWQPTRQWPMPQVPPPDNFPLEEERFGGDLQSPDGAPLSEKVKSYIEIFRQERSRSPIAVKCVREKEELPNGTMRFMYYMKAKDLPTAPDEAYPLAYHKCILSYISDLYFLGTVSRTLGLKRFSKGSQAVAMMSSLDHTIHFYSDNLDCGQWMLYVLTSSRAGSGRGVVHGQMFSLEGTLLAVISQEGVVRADVRAPDTAKL